MEPKIIDNINERVGDDLKQRLTPNSHLSIAAASFSIFAFDALKSELENIEELRFIFTSPTFAKSGEPKERREFYIPKLGRERNLYGTDFEIKLRNELSQKAIAKECAEWIRQKVQFKSNTTEMPMGGFIHIDDSEPFAYLPIYKFTSSELGYEKSEQSYTLVNVFSAPLANNYLKTFNELWVNKKKLEDVTNMVLEYVETVYQENPPEYIYFIALYNIFQEFLSDISEDFLPNEKIGFKDSEIWKKLYNFQHDAALSIINKLERYNGCILADSVGLGKTYTALAVIKYYESRNKSVLVLCPKKLNSNWQTFRSNYKNNPVAKDRFRYDILFHSDLSREKGESNGLDLERINWGSYDLVVIDESHNFRNGGKIDEDEEEYEELDEEMENDEEDEFEEVEEFDEEKEDIEEESTDEKKENKKKEEKRGRKKRVNRYVTLMNKIIRAGVETKVLMLSATPVNNRFYDLRNQLRLAYEGKTDEIDSRLGIDQSIDEVFRNAQKEYNKWAKLNATERTTERLLNSLSYNFFQLLDAVTIARSRSHVKNYYDMSEIGGFPERYEPISRYPELTDLEGALTFEDIAEQLNSLNFSIYTPSLYLFSTKKDDYTINFDGTGNLTLAGRERGLRRLVATNLLKRLESSVSSFSLTTERIRGYIVDTLSRIEDYEINKVGGEVEDLDVSEDELDTSEGDEELFATKKAKIKLSDIDTVRWKRDLEKDAETLDLLQLMLKDITPEHDSKLQMLLGDIRNKFKNPINDNNKKVLVFTAFADTAEYLYKNVAPIIKEESGLNVALITGSGSEHCTIRGLKADFNNILAYFSPIANERDKIYPNAKEDIDVLIATDCISEGQNIQDCDYLINYDIHWNPVRIIQRFGRIDRIGSKNSVIQLVNYWPNMELDEYINLKGRVENRMKAAVLTSSGDDNLLSKNEKEDLEYRRKQLERLKKEVVDLEDMDTGVNIMDLGLNEFRADLLSYIKEHPDVEHAPFGLSAVVASTDIAKPGIIFVLKNRNDAVNIDKKNLLHPFYMIYLAEDGEVLCDYMNPKKLLDIMRHTCKGKSDYDQVLCNIINKETADGRKMGKYSAQLNKAIESIIDTKRESDVRSLFSEGETTALMGKVAGLDDFELICFLIIR